MVKVVTSSTQMASQSCLYGWVNILEFICVPVDTKWLVFPIDVSKFGYPLYDRILSKPPTPLPQVWITYLFMVEFYQTNCRLLHEQLFSAHFH